MTVTERLLDFEQHPKLGPIRYASERFTDYDMDAIVWDQVAVIIPAHNEAATVGSVIEVTRDAGAANIWVVDNASDDDTGRQAWLNGAEVLSCPHKGKGEAMVAGWRQTTEEHPITLFLDADLTHLYPYHLQVLLAPFFDPRYQPELTMTLGTFDRRKPDVPGSNLAYWHLLPFLAGQRALHRSAMARILQHKELSQWNPEAITNAAFRHSRAGRTIPSVLDGVYHRTKNEKIGQRGQTANMLGRVSLIQLRELWQGLRHGSPLDTAERVLH